MTHAQETIFKTKRCTRYRSSSHNDLPFLLILTSVDVLEDEWGDELEEESEEELKSGSSLRGGLSNGAGTRAACPRQITL